MMAATEVLPSVNCLTTIVTQERLLDEKERTTYFRKSLQMSLTSSLLERITRSVTTVEMAVQLHRRHDSKRVIELTLTAEEIDYNIVEHVIEILKSKKYQCSLTDNSSNDGGIVVTEKMLTVKWSCV